MTDVKYTEDHEWIRIDGNEAAVGITDFAQDQLGELVFIELPEVGRDMEMGDDIAVIESVKAAGEVKAPASGTVTEINETLVDSPETVNESPMTDGWFFKLKLNDPSQLDNLMDEDAYLAFIKNLA